MASLDEQAREALAGDPDAPAIEYERRWYDWGSIRAIAEQVGALLADAGVPALAPVAFVPRNRPVAIAAELGLVAARQTIRMVYAFQSPEGIARDIGGLDVAAVVAMAEDFTPEVLEVIGVRGLAAITLGDMRAAAVAGHSSSTRAIISLPHEPEISVHTSGTTGPPKHVGFSYATIARYIVGENLIPAGDGGPLPPVPLYFPLGNISGVYSVLPPLLNRWRVALFDRFSLEGWFDWVERFQPVAAGLPPAAVRMVLDADTPKERLGRIRIILAGAAPRDPTVQRAFEERYGIPILLSYGATEFGGPVAAMRPEDIERFGTAKLGSVGRPYAGAAIRVVDPETGAERGADEDGLLEVKAPRIGPDWLRTTDIGMLDADGFLFLRGRADGAIMRGGFKLLPETIERALCEHPAVAGAIVVGIEDMRLGQVPAAVLQIKTGHTRPSENELASHLRRHVYATHIPTHWAFVPALPLNTSAKPDLAAARRLFAAPSEAVP